MSYCVALKLSRGLIFMSDTLTNGGLDDISNYPKTFSWGVPGDRQVLLTTAGNLATSQAVVKTLSEQIKDKNNGSQSILNAPTMFQIQGPQQVASQLKRLSANNVAFRFVVAYRSAV